MLKTDKKTLWSKKINRTVNNIIQILKMASKLFWSKYYQEIKTRYRRNICNIILVGKLTADRYQSESYVKPDQVRSSQVKSVQVKSSQVSSNLDMVPYELSCTGSLSIHTICNWILHISHLRRKEKNKVRKKKIK